MGLGVGADADARLAGRALVRAYQLEPVIAVALQRLDDLQMSDDLLVVAQHGARGRARIVDDLVALTGDLDEQLAGELLELPALGVLGRHQHRYGHQHISRWVRTLTLSRSRASRLTTWRTMLHSVALSPRYISSSMHSMMTDARSTELSQASLSARALTKPSSPRRSRLTLA